MGKQVIAYPVIQSTIPDYVFDGGYYLHNLTNEQMYIGISTALAEFPRLGVKVFTDKLELKNYLELNCLFGWNAAEPTGMNTFIVTSELAADEVWSKLDD